MIKQRYGVPSFLALGAVMLVASPSLAASWQEGVNYGGGTNMNLYVPDAVDAAPGVVVALHSCGNQYESDSRNYVQSSADEYGFVIIQPTNGSPDCWTADAGQEGEKPDIVAMVNYVLENNDADPTRIFVMGASSGACMTLAMLATHPDLFAAGATLAGVPYGAWRQGGSCSVCSAQPTSQSEEQWGNIVRDNAPDGYAGPWPRVQLWHGTGDSTLLPGWLQEAEKQWKNVHALTSAAESAEGPSGWSRTEYTKDGKVVLQVNSGAGKDHYLPDDVPQAEFVKFFGLDQDAPVDEPGPVGSGGAGSVGGAGNAGEGNTPGAAGAGTGGAPQGAAGATGGAGPTPTEEPTPDTSGSTGPAEPVPNASTPAPVPTPTTTATATPTGTTTATATATATTTAAPGATPPAATTTAPAVTPVVPTTSSSAPAAADADEDEGGCAVSAPRSHGASGTLSLLAAGMAAAFVRRRTRKA